MRAFAVPILSAMSVMAMIGVFADAATAESGWTDKKEQFRLTLPPGWKSDPDLTVGDFSIFKGPSGASLLIMVSAATGTPAEEIEAKRASLVRDNADLTYSFGPVINTRVGNEQAKSLETTYVRKDQPRGKRQSFSTTIVNHTDTQYEFLARKASAPYREALFRSPRRAVCDL